MQLMFVDTQILLQWATALEYDAKKKKEQSLGRLSLEMVQKKTLFHLLQLNHGESLFQNLPKLKDQMKEKLILKDFI